MAVQLASYILPLIRLPYLSRILEPEGWGTLVFIQSIINVFLVVTEYGFSYTATRDLSASRNQHKKRSNLIFGVITAKTGLSILSVFLLIFISFFIESFYSNLKLLGAGCFLLIVHSLSPLWYFQAVERLRLSSIITIAGNAIATALIFVFVTNPSHHWIVLFLQALFTGISTLLLYYLMVKKEGFVIGALADTRQALVSGWNVFVSRGAVTLYNQANAFILGLFATPYQVGYFAGAEKLSSALVGLFQPVFKAVYPRLSYLNKHDEAKAQKITSILLKVISAAGIGTVVATWLAGDYAILFILGDDYQSSVPLLKLFIIVLPFKWLNNILGIQMLLAKGFDKLFNKIVLVGGMFNLILAIILVPFLFEWGITITVVITEIIIFVLLVIAVRKKLDSYYIKIDQL